MGVPKQLGCFMGIPIIRMIASYSFVGFLLWPRFSQATMHSTVLPWVTLARLHWRIETHETPPKIGIPCLYPTAQVGMIYEFKCR